MREQATTYYYGVLLLPGPSVDVRRGSKAPSGSRSATSGLAPLTDMLRVCRHVSNVPLADVTGNARAATKALRLIREVRMAAYRGSCICGEVVFEVDGPFDHFLSCHCSRCRKATGTAHSCEVIVKASAVRWLRGEGSVARFDLPQARSFATAFCKQCGSPMPHLTLSLIHI